MRKELTTNNIEYDIIYCRAKDYSNGDMWHFTTGNINRLQEILNWCKQNDLIIKSVKTRIIK